MSAHELSTVPAWPMHPVEHPALLKFDSLHCSEDGRVRVATIGDNFCGPFKTEQAAGEYGASWIKP